MAGNATSVLTVASEQSTLNDRSSPPAVTKFTQDHADPERAKTLIKLADVQIPASEVSKIAEYSDRIALEFGPPVVSGVKEVLSILSGSYRLAVICNTGWHGGKTVRRLLAEYDLSKYFSHLTFSDEAAVAKPVWDDIPPGTTQQGWVDKTKRWEDAYRQGLRLTMGEVYAAIFE